MKKSHALIGLLLVVILALVAVILLKPSEPARTAIATSTISSPQENGAPATAQLRSDAPSSSQSAVSTQQSTSTDVAQATDTPAAPVKGTWSSHWEQGKQIYTASIDRNNYFELYCETSFDHELYEDSVSMIVTIGDKSYDWKNFHLVIDGEDFEIDSTDCDICAKNWEATYESLRTAKSILAVTNDGKKLSLPVKGVSKILPKYAKNDSCQAAAWR